jgi:glucosamine-6-phosphate deaminase
VASPSGSFPAGPLPSSPENRFEKLPIWIAASAEEVHRRAAAEIAGIIRAREAEGRPAVLGLATGSTPVGVYRELIRLHREEGLSFRRVITFNLDEYYGTPPDAPGSYHRFMQEHLFAHIDIAPGNIHLPDGTVPREKVAEACRAYEQRIRDAGGLDLQLLGIGRTGHIGFNEPGSIQRSRTRVITLDHLTRRDNAPFFSNPEEVPLQALTMGIGTILEARRVLLLAFGEHKAEIVRRAFEGEITPDVPASFLQNHDNVLVMLDPAAAGHLTRMHSPWLTGPVADLGLEWNEALMRRAVTWLARTAQKSVLKLTDLDYNEHGLQELLSHYGAAYDINLKVFRLVSATITGWPAGRPHQVGGPRRVLIFSPHPEDAVLAMGGTLLRLAQQGHEVHLAFQLDGGHAVSDRTLHKFTAFARAALPGAAPFPQEARALKAAIRRLEAVAAAGVCGVPEPRLSFLNLPFAGGGLPSRSAVSEEDVDAVYALVDRVRPQQIYAGGDFASPDGTHRLCLQAVERALARARAAGAGWPADCPVWLYRGIWKEWGLHEIEMAVPLSPGEVLHKRRAIFQHESPRGQAMFLGGDDREFWQRAEENTRATARAFNAFGLVDYEAIETFAKG